MAKKPNIHITPRHEGWAVIKEKNDRATSIEKTQQEAINEGRKIAKKDQVEIVIHGKDGKIRDKDSYGNDPNPPKDKKH